MAADGLYTPPAEPTSASLPRVWQRYLLATRPAFLAASLVPCLLGFTTAYADGHPFNLSLSLALLTVPGALLVHAGVNVLNDYYDDRNGTDALNRERLFPFTGGSRFIQNGVFTAQQTLIYGLWLLAGAAAIGAGLALLAGPGLWWIGALGLFIGWAYSAPPFSLNSRGLGECCVGLGFGLLIPLGADYVQRSGGALSPLQAGIPYALLATNLLYINQFPDRRADAAAGKHHWVVRLGARRARWVYAGLALLAYGVLLAEVVLGVLPVLALLALVPAPLSGLAALVLLRHAGQPARLAGAIRLTILSLLGHGLLLAVALVLAARLG